MRAPFSPKRLSTKKTPHHYHNSRPSHLEPPSSGRHSVTSSINSSTSRRSILERLTSPFFETNDREFKVYPQRFLNLLLLSLLNFISDWQCYSIAPVGDFVEEKYEGLHSEALVSLFLFGNFIVTFLEPQVVHYFSLRGCVCIGAFTMTVGSFLKSCIYNPFLTDNQIITLGTFIIGLSQPLVQCTPALLSSTWFPHNERTMATSLALNSNQLGIGFSFGVGAAVVRSVDDVQNYFLSLAVGTMCVCICTIFFFVDKPLTPPSHSAMIVSQNLKNKHKPPPIIHTNNKSAHPQPPQTPPQDIPSRYGTVKPQPPYTVEKVRDDSDEDSDSAQSSETVATVVYEVSFISKFLKPGFVHALIAFTTSAIVINVLSTFMDPILQYRGHGKKYTAIVGFTFQMLVMCSSFVVGGYTDNNRNYFTVIITLLIIGAVFLAVCGYALEGASGQIQIWWALLLVSVTVGPLQPIATELGVEVVYPQSENVVLVLQQLSANLLSALFIPVFEALKYAGTDWDTPIPMYAFSFGVLTFLHALATLQFMTFKGTYRRLRHENMRKVNQKKRVHSRDASEVTKLLNLETV
ncbi:hypothetical protein TrVE_jg652 [Triparma verrucosa]|uniref:Major facilitator superfamily (MFS) profile domain-containing protein n=1 Tax=Triparma verrucosa TaxID=1606542 RepID=A0A9W7FNI4_9STRA|nr:hypothetical protein TrVE_jg652 [Triparma verrucosa]